MKKKILISGATDGIGLLTAEKLVEAGHHLLIHGRNAEKLHAAESKFKKIGSGNVERYRADFSHLNDVQRMAQNIALEHSHLDVIINNAGIYKTGQPITEDGLDVRFVVNTFAPYLLTKSLLALMNSEGRVVNLSSAAQEPVDLAAMSGQHRISSQFSAYAQSKLALTMWSRSMALKATDIHPAFIAINPGSLLASKMVKEGFGVAGKDLNIGADMLIRASLSDEFADASGTYFDNDIGAFSSPHSDALDTTKSELLINSIEAILKKHLRTQDH